MAWTVVSNSCCSVYPNSSQRARLTSKKRPSRPATAMPSGALWNVFVKRCCDSRSSVFARLRLTIRLMGSARVA
jgi:hypothetical protein